jgi:hypothetical protein
MVGNIIFDQWLKPSSVTDNLRYRTIAMRPSRQSRRPGSLYFDLIFSLLGCKNVGLERAFHTVVAVGKVKYLRPSWPALL